MKLLILTFLLFISCKVDSTVNEKIKASIVNDKIKLENLSDEDMYYIILTDESVTYTDWRPFIKEFSSKILADSSLEIDAEKTKTMKSFLIYFWFKSDDLNQDDIADKSYSVRLDL